MYKNLRNRFILAFILMLVIPFKLVGEEITDSESYNKLWQKVQESENQRLPETALKTVNEIYDISKEESNASQFIKAIIHKMKYSAQVEDDSDIQIFNQLEGEIKNSEFPIKPVLHSILAEAYWQYFQANRWTIFERTETVNFVLDDIRTWDLKKIFGEIIKHYEISLENTEELKNIKIDFYNEILNVGNTKYLRPTLYDFLAFRAVDFYMNDESGLTKPAYEFIIKEEKYFLPAEDFIKHELTTRDTLSLKFHALKLLRDLVEFHLNDEKKDALIDADLKRLHFIYQNTVNPDKINLYENALIALKEKYKVLSSSAEISYALANLYFQLGNKYNPLVSDEYKWYKKKAHDICVDIIELFPDTFEAQNSRSLLPRIKEKILSLNVETVNIPHKPILALFKYKNINQVYFRIIKLSFEERSYYLINHYHDEILSKFLEKKPIKEWSTTLPDDGDFNQHSVEIKLPELGLGYYLVLISHKKDFDLEDNGIAYSPFTVSNISYIQRRTNDDIIEFHVFNRETGESIKDVKANIWFNVYNYKKRKNEIKKAKEEFLSDYYGYFHIRLPIKFDEKARNFYVSFTKDNDKLISSEMFRNYDYGRDDESYIKTYFFTDRAIYRPGQTVYFKGIVLKIDGKENTIKTDFKTTVVLNDVNYQKISELQLVTNEYGSFSGVFTIPQNVLTGNFKITDGYGSHSISVEEYKRPKFEVKFEPVKESYKVNEVVKVKGFAKAYAGFNIDNADLTYRVIRTVSFPFWWYFRGSYNPYSAQMEITHGYSKTNEKGEFEIEFQAIPDLKIPEEDDPTFTFQIIADVTDINGETHSAQQYVRVGYSVLRLTLNIPDKINKDLGPFEYMINSVNLNGQFEPAAGKAQIYKLKTPEKLFRKKRWQKADKFIFSQDEYYSLFPYDIYKDEYTYYNWEKEEKVLEKDFNTEEDNVFKVKKLSKWEQGVYVVELLSKDKYGKEVKDVRYFTLFSEKKKNLPYKMFNWFSVLKGGGEPGDNAEILIGSSDTGVNILYEIEHNNQIIYREWFTLNNRQKLIKIPIKEKYRGNFVVHFTFVKQNRVYYKTQLINVPWTNKNLNITFETFRDKLLPGENEEWRIKIKDNMGERVAAEMLATLYDASLDAFKINSWYFNINPYYYSKMRWNFNANFNTKYSIMFLANWNTYISSAIKIYDSLNWFGMNWYRGFGHKGLVSYMSVDGGAVRTPEGLVEESVAGDEMELKTKDQSGKEVITPGIPVKEPVEETPELASIKARTDFSETAFFYPHLKTNEEGDVIISFYIPEALTRWKMLGLAHTKDLKYGSIQNQLITQKDLMIIPNAPRFFRERDDIIFTAKITNLAENDLEGDAQLMLFDAVTMQPIDELFGNNNSQRSFKVKKEQSTLVSWDISIPEGVQAVTYRVVARAGNFSDGEEKAIPILTNRMLVTESLPLPVRGNQTKDFKFDKLLHCEESSTLKHQKLTLEFTSNPAWYAIQALPYLMEYPYECSEQIFSRFYANSIASHIANSSPKIKRVFDSWKNLPGSDALLSNLEKNQELKALLLEETPWVLDAQNESERKKRVALLFDLNRMSNELESAVKKLIEAQTSNGGWAWFKGMPDSRYITQHIVTGFGHLDHLNIRSVRENKQVWDMLEKAVLYLDERIREDYEWLLKHVTNIEDDHIRRIQIQYLYSRSYFKDIPTKDRNEKAFEYFKKQAQKYWINKSKYMQGMISLALHRYDDKKTPMKIINSLKEYALHSEELGMYWKDFWLGFYWYQAPIETQALLIEAFDEVANDTQAVEEMKVWLLKQKQTQDWRTTKATVEACYALLLRGTEFLENDELVEITIAGELIDPEKLEDTKIEAGTGYFKTSWSKGEIIPEMGNVTVTNKNDVVAWGALYWQYFEDLDKITPHETPLKLNKKLFIEKFSDTGKIIKPITDKNSPKIGDRIIVRIELRVDRDMEFVHMKDMRASCMEPENVFSRYKWQDGLGYYESTRDASTNFFFDYLPKGTYVFEYPLRVTHEGDFSNGISSIQCMYAPEFTSHSEGIRVEVVE